MTIEKIVWYVQHTPHNTNRAVLEQMLKDLILSHGGQLDGPDSPDDEHIVYDGGVEE